MRMVVAGGSGFLGGALTRRLAADGHDVVVLTRHPRPAANGVRSVAWHPDAGDESSSSAAWTREIDGAGALINLAGEGIADKRWTAARKSALLESRVKATAALVRA